MLVTAVKRTTSPNSAPSLLQKPSLVVILCAVLFFALQTVSETNSAQAQTASICTNGIVVPNPKANPRLVSDCEALLEARAAWSKDSFFRQWSGNVPIRRWEGVLLFGGRVDHLGVANGGLKR